MVVVMVAAWGGAYRSILAEAREALRGRLISVISLGADLAEWRKGGGRGGGGVWGGGDACYDRGSTFGPEWFLNDGASLTQNRRKCRVLRYRGIKVYRFLA